jgi:hypothetical protein
MVVGLLSIYYDHEVVHLEGHMWRRHVEETCGGDMRRRHAEEINVVCREWLVENGSGMAAGTGVAGNVKWGRDAGCW